MPASWRAQDAAGAAVTDMSPPGGALLAGRGVGRRRERPGPGRLRVMNGAACRTRTDDLLLTTGPSPHDPNDTETPCHENLSEIVVGPDS